MLGSDNHLLPVSMMIIARIDSVAGPTKSQSELATPTARDCVSFDDIATPFFGAKAARITPPKTNGTPERSDRKGVKLRQR